MSKVQEKAERVQTLIKAHRDKAGSVAKLSRALGISRQSIYTWMSGEVLPTPNTLANIAQAENQLAQNFAREAIKILYPSLVTT